MSKKPPPADPFIVFDISQKRENSETRRKIRSRAAQHSHRVGPRRYKQPTGREESQEDTPSLGPSATTASASSTEPSTPEAAFARPPALSRCHSELGWRAATPLEAAEDVNARPNARRMPSYADGSKTLVPEISRTPLANGLQRRMDDILVYPVPEQPFFFRTMKFMWDWMLDAWKELEATDKDRADALVWVQRVTFTEPCYFYMNMLSACSNLVDHGMMDPTVMPWLMAHVVRAINLALQDPERMLSTGVILAVGRIALREIVRGDRDVGVKVHRPAQVKMMAMAGGLDALALPLLVESHVQWAERIIRRRTGNSMLNLMADAAKRPPCKESTTQDEEVLRRYFARGESPKLADD